MVRTEGYPSSGSAAGHCPVGNHPADHQSSAEEPADHQSSAEEPADHQSYPGPAAPAAVAEPPNQQPGHKPESSLPLSLIHI